MQSFRSFRYILLSLLMVFAFNVSASQGVSPGVNITQHIDQATKSTQHIDLIASKALLKLSYSALFDSVNQISRSNKTVKLIHLTAKSIPLRYDKPV